MNEPRPTINAFALGEFETNCFLVTVPGSTACWIVDCGYEPQALLSQIDQAGLHPEAILLTHCHCDHIAGLDRVLHWARRRGLELPVLASRAETGFCSRPELNLS
ncbi:MAG: MBL fold metallo-hydrolase, partial [Phycisphaerales bacterium]|nr:MBL fold metallo-hydrolase [Phycisphaerales bacterium]